MSRQCPRVGIVVCFGLALLAGCHPQQPFYLYEDGDLSHYLGVATEIEYPDVEVESLAEAEGTMRPFSLDGNEPTEMWDLSLEEAIRCALANSKVMRTLGGQVLATPGSILRTPEAIPTVYDPALVEADPQRGVEAALSAFDAQFDSTLFWEKGDAPQNVSPALAFFRPSVMQQDSGSFQAELAKTAATGGTWVLRHNVEYAWNNVNQNAIATGNSPSQAYASDWNVNLEAEFRQPLWQGRGAQFNRIAGPGASPGSYGGVVIARINTDIALAKFEAGVRDLVYDVENAYWELYFAYRRLDAMKKARDRSLDTWQAVRAQYRDLGIRDEAQTRHQYFEFRGTVEELLSALYAAENNLRYMMGLAATDGRLIRPADEPATGEVVFDWCEILSEGLTRSVELREQKWEVKQRELELIAAKNHLLPRLDAMGRYRWLGMGDDLIQASGGTGDPTLVGSNAYQSMTSGDFQEWQFGLELSMPIGFRRELAGVRHAELMLARDRARLQEQELELSHQLTAAIRRLQTQHKLTETEFNRRVAAQTELEGYKALEDKGRPVRDEALDRLLDAQRRAVLAEADYYRSLVDYNKAIAEVHYRKGSLLEYNGVCLSEGPWPGKAYFDARRSARARDAGLFLDYGYTRPKVISRGAYRQHAGGGLTAIEDQSGLGAFDDGAPEPIPTPAPLPMGMPAEPPEPEPMRSDDGYTGAGGSAADGPQAAGAELVSGRPEAETVRRASAVEPVEMAELAGPPEPTDRPGIDRPRESRPKAAELKWSNLEGWNTRHETDASPSAVETDRSASGWKGVQR